MSKADRQLAILGIAQTATEALLGVQIGAWKFDEIERQCRRSVYWPQFVECVVADQVPEDWLPGALGRVVIGWAHNEIAALLKSEEP